MDFLKSKILSLEEEKKNFEIKKNKYIKNKIYENFGLKCAEEVDGSYENTKFENNEMNKLLLKWEEENLNTFIEKECDLIEIVLAKKRLRYSRIKQNGNDSDSVERLILDRLDNEKNIKYVENNLNQLEERYRDLILQIENLPDNQIGIEK